MQAAHLIRIRRPALVGSSLIGIVLLGLLINSVVVPRVRARQQPSDWFQSKHLTLAPVVKGLMEPTYVASAPNDSSRLAAGELYVVDIQGGTIYRVVDGTLP